MTGQKKFKFRQWGGKRKGAGRKRKSPRPTVKHDVRPPVNKNDVAHVTLRINDSIGYLRKREPMRVINWALAVMSKRTDMRICQISIQGNHVHLICEATDGKALSCGIRAFEISVTRGLNGLCGRKGNVFPDRYHLRVIKSPTQLRNTLNYVFGNWRHHGYDRYFQTGMRFDPYSSANTFGGFKELSPIEQHLFRPDGDVFMVSLPKTWLLREGWRKGGGLISCFSVPGQRAFSR